MDEVRELIYAEILEYHPMAMQAHISGGWLDVWCFRGVLRRDEELDLPSPCATTSRHTPRLRQPQRRRWLQKAVYAPREQPRLVGLDSN